MRISKVTIELETEDLNSILSEFVPDTTLWVKEINEDGIRGHLRFLFWNIDFVAKPYSLSRDELNIDVTAHKLVTIPTSIIQRSLREAMKDAPPGIDVIQQMLRVKITSLLRPFGVALEVEELKPYDGFVRITLAGIHAHSIAALLHSKSGTEMAASLDQAQPSERPSEQPS